MEKENKFKNKHGFTLVELLAVIVVLSIITLIAFYAVLPMVEKSKKNALKIEAEGLAKAAQLYVANKAIESGNGTIPDGGCVISVKKLIDMNISELDSNHKGFVEINRDNANNSYSYKVFLYNNDYVICNKNSSKYEATDVANINDESASGPGVYVYNANIISNVEIAKKDSNNLPIFCETGDNASNWSTTP